MGCCHFLLQEIFPTQGSNPGLLHCWQTLYHLSHQGIPEKVYMCPQVSQCLDACHIEGWPKGSCGNRKKLQTGNSVREPMSLTFILSLCPQPCVRLDRRGRRNFRSHFPLSPEAYWSYRNERADISVPL